MSIRGEHTICDCLYNLEKLGLVVKGLKDVVGASKAREEVRNRQTLSCRFVKCCETLCIIWTPIIDLQIDDITYMLNSMNAKFHEEGEDHKEHGKNQGRLDVRSNVRTGLIALYFVFNTRKIVSKAILT